MAFVLHMLVFVVLALACAACVTAGVLQVVMAICWTGEAVLLALPVCVMLLTLGGLLGWAACVFAPFSIALKTHLC